MLPHQVEQVDHMSKSKVLSHRPNRGFTLVELLVVMAIIGELVAILVPAVQMALEAARRTQCLSNEMEIGKAIQIYEKSNNHYPGSLNTVSVSGGTSTVNLSWVQVLMPYLGRGDIWAALQKGSSPAVQVNVLICPMTSTT